MSTMCSHGRFSLHTAPFLGGGSEVRRKFRLQDLWPVWTHFTIWFVPSPKSVQSIVVKHSSNQLYSNSAWALGQIDNRIDRQLPRGSLLVTVCHWTMMNQMQPGRQFPSVAAVLWLMISWLVMCGMLLLSQAMSIASSINTHLMKTLNAMRIFCTTTFENLNLETWSWCTAIPMTIHDVFLLGWLFRINNTWSSQDIFNWSFVKLKGVEKVFIHINFF